MYAVSEGDRMSVGSQPEHPRSGVPTFTTAGEEQSSPDGELLTMQQSHFGVYSSLVDAVRHDTQRKILSAVYDGMGSVTYDEIDRYVTVGRRAVRKHLKKLEDADVLERADGRSGSVSFASFEAEALAEHALSCYHT